MRLALDPRTRRLLRRVPHTNVYSALELALLGLLAVQCARLFWAALVPLGPVGDWRGAVDARPVLTASPELLGFDPFFRLIGDSGAVTVTALDLTLYGVREDRASGRGSAIIGTSDGQQKSFLVGEEIIPGVTLTGVSFDGVTIDRGGVTEQLFLDQSTPAEVVGPAPAPAPTPTPSPEPAPVQADTAETAKDGQ